jgi:Ca-activated chloride channel family protein
MLFIASVLFLISAPARAQEKEEEGQKQETKQAAQSAQQSLVRLNVLVTDSANRPVTDLRQEDFRVLEDGKPQTISYFSQEELPVSYGIMVDASGSMRELLNHLIETGRNIVSSNKADDEAFVMRFVDSDSIQVEEGFTSNKDALYEALDGIYVEGGQTAVMDAINRAVEYHKKSRRSGGGGDVARRHAIVLITDGEDRGSQTRNLDSILPRLREDDVQFFVIGLTNLSAVQGSREKAVAFLTRIAELSGGRAFFPKSPAELPNIAEEITRDLHTQYLIGYNPTNAARNGSFRKVQVSVADTPSRKKLNVIMRPGYTAPR